MNADIWERILRLERIAIDTSRATESRQVALLQVVHQVRETWKEGSPEDDRPGARRGAIRFAVTGCDGYPLYGATCRATRFGTTSTAHDTPCSGITDLTGMPGGDYTWTVSHPRFASDQAGTARNDGGVIVSVAMTGPAAGYVCVPHFLKGEPAGDTVFFGSGFFYGGAGTVSWDGSAWTGTYVGAVSGATIDVEITFDDTSGHWHYIVTDVASGTPIFGADFTDDLDPVNYCSDSFGGGGLLHAPSASWGV